MRQGTPKANTLRLLFIEMHVMQNMQTVTMVTQSVAMETPACGYLPEMNYTVQC